MLVSKPNKKRALQICRQNWEDNITMNLKETGFKDVYWIHLP